MSRRTRRHPDDANEVADLHEAANWSSATARMRAFQTGRPRFLRYRALTDRGRLYVRIALVLATIVALLIAANELFSNTA